MDDRLNSLISLYGENLENLIQSLPFSAHVRDCKTNKFLIANPFQATNNGLKNAEEVCHLTPVDLWANYKTLYLRLGAWLTHEETTRSQFKQALFKVENLQTPASFQEEWLLPNGVIYFGMNKKIPIVGKNQQTVAVFTYSYEISARIDLFKRYLAYKRCYKSEKCAIFYFLKSLGIEHTFQVQPTHAELLVLLALSQASTYKLAVELLHKTVGVFIKPGTVGVHLQNLRKKLKTSFHLSKLLTSMR
jgi:hypothetical protein